MSSSQPITSEQFAYLYRLNIAACIVHLASAMVIFVMTDKDAKVPLTSNATMIENRFAYGSPKEHARLPVGYLAGGFLLLASMNHFVTATFLKSRYEQDLQHSQNHIRWFEYSFSASIMHLMIAMLCGITDIHLLICVFGLTMITMVFGSELERSNAPFQGKPEMKSMRLFWIGCIPWLLSWGIIASYFIHNATEAPDFVWAILIGILLLDSSFAIHSYLQQQEIWKWKEYYNSEIGYIVLSFTAKSLLAWINFGGTRGLPSS
jgi:hypothetical protein